MLARKFLGVAHPESRTAPLGLECGLQNQGYGTVPTYPTVTKYSIVHTCVSYVRYLDTCHVSALLCFVVFGWFQTKKTSGILSDFQKNRQHLKICKVRSDPYFSEESSKTQLSQITARRQCENANNFVGLEHTREISTGNNF